MNVLVYFATLNVKHINEHFNIAEYVVSLSRKIMFHESLLTTAVPQVKHQITQESHIRLLDVNLNNQEKKFIFKGTKTFTHKKICVWVLGLVIYPYQIFKPKIIFDTQKLCIWYLVLGNGYRFGYHTNTHTQYSIPNFFL